MQVHNVSQAVDAITERAQMMENTSFEMSPAERARLELEVNTLNRQNFPENRVPKQELGKDDFLQLLIRLLLWKTRSLSGRWHSFHRLNK